MKKFVRFMAVLIGIILATVIVLAFIEPTDILVSRSTMINAPKEAVFEQMVLFRNWTNWSPWYKLDTAMRMTYAGTDGQPESSYHWIGDENKTGEGTMKNLGVKGTEMNFDVNFDKPRRGEAHGVLKATDTAGMTKATWSFSMHIPFPLNAMCVFMNMDKLLGGDFENGLANMKQYVEVHNTSKGRDVEIKEVVYAEHIIEGYHKTVSWSDFDSFSKASYRTLDNETEGRRMGPATGLYYTWDTVHKNTDMVAGFPVSDTASPASGAVIMHVAASRAYMTVFNGPYQNMMKYHMALQKYCEAKRQQHTLVIEEYVVDRLQTPDSTRWVTNIYYLVQ